MTKINNPIAVSGVVRLLVASLLFLPFSSTFAGVTASGTYAHSIPIEAPPGIQGIQPSISIDYNSANVGADNYVGMSWSLNGLSDIRRINTGKGINYAGQDSFMSPEGLLIANGDGSYSSLNQNFSRYVPQGQCGDSFCSWVVYLSNGSKQYFGATSDSRISAIDHPGSVRVWAISKVENPSGLYWEAEYIDYGDGNYYPLRISYTKGAGLFFHVVKFDYVLRSEYYARYTQSTAVSTTRILSGIETNSDCLIIYCPLGRKVSRWELQHQDYQGQNLSKFTSYARYFFDLNGNVATDLTFQQNFSYNIDGETGAQYVLQGGAPIPTGSCAAIGNPPGCYDYLNFKFIQYPPHPGWDWFSADINGDGKADMVQVILDNAWIGTYSYVWQPDGTYKFHSVKTGYTTIPNITGSLGWNFHLRSGDFNGDGLSDFMLLTGYRATYADPHTIGVTTALSNGDGTFTVYFQATPWLANLDWSRETAFVGDINGDGLHDVYFLSDKGGGQVAINTLVSNGNGTFIVERKDTPWIATWDKKDSIFSYGDFDGNGKGDISLVTNSNGKLLVRVAFMEEGNTLSFVSQELPIEPHWDGINDIFRIADINSDGKSDLLFITNSSGNARIYSMISNGGRQLELHQQDTGITPTWNEQTSIWLSADLNGDMKSDVVLIQNLNGEAYLHLLHSKGNGNFQHSEFPSGVFPLWDKTGEKWLLGDLDANGITDLHLATNSQFRIFTLRANKSIPSLTGIHDAQKSIAISYLPKATLPGTLKPTTFACGLNQSGNICGSANLTPKYLVTSEVITADGLTKSKHYDYSNSRMFFGDILRTADAGFEWIKQTDDQTGATVQTFYNQTKPFLGIPVKTVTTSGNGQFQSVVLQSDLRQFSCNDAGCTRNDAPDLMLPHLMRIANQQQDTYDDKGVHLTKSKQVLAYDNYGSENISVQTFSGNSVSKATTIETTYINDLGSTKRFIAVPALQRNCLGNACSGTVLNQTRYTYDNQQYLQIGNAGLLTKKEAWLFDDVWTGETYGYDSLGNSTLVTNQAGVTKAIEYDADYKGYPIRTTLTSQGVSRVTTQQFDSRFGIPISQTDALGVTTTQVLDGRGRVISAEIRDEATKLLRKTSNVYHLDTAADRYSDSCQYYLEDFSAQTCTRKYVDGFGRVIREVTPSVQGTQASFLAKTYGYDIQGRKITESEALFATDLTGQITPSRFTSYSYDALNRVTQITAPDGKISAKAYNADLISGSVALESNTTPDGSINKKYTNIDGSPLRVIQALGTPKQAIIDYSYDPLGRLTSVTSSHGTTTMAYDPQYRWQTSVEDPNVGRTSYTYVTDISSLSFGKVLTETRPDSNSTSAGTTGITTFMYNDPWGRMTEAVRADGTKTVYVYDENDMTYGTGELTTRTHTTAGYTVAERFAYSALGESTKTIRRISHASLTLCSNANDLPCLSTISSEQDKLGRVQTMSYPDGLQTTLSYFGATTAINQITHNNTAFVTYSNYNQWGKPESITYGNGTAHTYSFDASVGILKGFNVKKGATTLVDMQYCNDQSFNITRLIDGVVTANTVNYTYDSLNRIASSKRGVPQQDCTPYAGASQTYEFDVGNSFGSKGNLEIKNNRKLLYNGNRFQPSGDQVWDTNTSTWKDNQAFTWSAGGNLLSKGTAMYQYTAENMLAHASEPTTGESDFYYDADGQRFLKVFKKHGAAAIKTWYVGGGMEVRQTASADLATIYAFQMSKYVYSPEGQKVASITGALNESFAMASSRFSMMAASYSGDSFAGLAGKIEFTFYAFMHDDAAKRKVYLSVLTLFAALLASYFVRTWSSEDNTSTGFRNSVFYRAISISMAMIFLSVSSNCVGRSDVEMNPIFQSGNAPTGAFDFSSIYAGLPVGTYYYHPDHIGSGSLITDASGNEVMRIVYDAYGNIDQFASGKWNPDTEEMDQEIGSLSVLVMAAKFTGQEYDPEIGFYYYNARYYDPNLGQFTTPDSEVPNPQSAHSYNRYMYVAGNPVKMIDPTGHWEFSIGLDSNGGGSFYFDAGNGNGSGGGRIGGGGGSAPSSSLPPVAPYNPGYNNGSGSGAGVGGMLGGVPLMGYFFPNSGSYASGSGLSGGVDSGPYFGTPTPQIFGRSGNLYAASSDRRIMNDADPVYALETPGNHAARQAQINSNIYYAPLYNALDNLRNDVITDAIVGGMARFAAIGGGGRSVTGVNGTKGWRVGQPINNLTGAGNVPAWSTVRQRYWKNEAFFNSGKYEPEDVLRLEKGLAPQRFNRATGQMESKELHHTPPQRDGGLFDVEALWPDEHAARDAYRRLRDIGAY